MWNPEHSRSWATHVRVMKCDHFCATLYVLYLWVYCSHSPLVVWRFFCSHPKLVLTLRKITIRAWRKLRIPIARLPLGSVPIWRRGRSCLQITGDPVEAVGRTLCRTSNLCEGRPRSRILRCSRTVSLFCLTARNGFFSSWVLARCSSCHRLHSLFARAKSGRRLSGCFGLCAFCVRIQCFEFWILWALVAS